MKTYKYFKILLIPFFLLSLNIYAQNQWVWYHPNNSGIPGWIVNEMVIDSTNVKWFATDQGLARLKGNTWTVWDTNNSPLTQNRLTSIVKDKENKLWIGTYSKGIFKFDGVNWTHYYNTNFGYPIRFVNRIRIDNNNTVWVCCQVLGLLKYNRIANEWIRYYPLNSPIPDYFVTDVKFEGNIKWIGTVNGGIARFDDTSWTIYNDTNSPLLSNFIEGIGIDNYNNKWFCTRFGGVAKFNTLQNQWTIYTSTNSGLYWNNTSTIFIDPENVKWIGIQGGGFVRFDDYIWTRMHDSTYYSSVLNFSKDKYGNLWICETNGVFVYNHNGVVNIENHNQEVLKFKLNQNFPNPFNSSTKIVFELSRTTNVKVTIYDIAGKEILTLVNGQKSPGKYTVSFNANNLSSGIYFYVLNTNEFNETKTMILLK